MRLIDADALMRSIEPILEAEEQIYGCSSWCFAIKCRDEVQDAPSVDAVPVEWIEEEIKRLREMDNDFAGLTANIINTMLKRYKKEDADG